MADLKKILRLGTARPEGNPASEGDGEQPTAEQSPELLGVTRAERVAREVIAFGGDGSRAGRMAREMQEAALRERDRLEAAFGTQHSTARESIRIMQGQMDEVRRVNARENERNELLGAQVTLLGHVVDSLVAVRSEAAENAREASRSARWNFWLQAAILAVGVTTLLVMLFA